MYSENFLSKKLKAFAEKNEWLISGEYIYGEEQGFLFTGMDGKGQKTFITPVPRITEEQQTELFEMLEKNRSTMKLTEYAVTDDFLCIRIKDSMQLKPDDLDFILALLVGSLQDLGLDPVGRCQECGETGADTEHFICDLYCYMHEDCIKAIENARDEDSDNDQDAEEGDEEESDEDSDEAKEEAFKIPVATEGSDDVKTGKKILFTLGGAVVGAIPWLALPYAVDFLSGLIEKITTSTLVTNFVQSLLTCVCAYLISYAAILGYRLSKAKMNMKGRWITGIVSIAVVIVVQFAYLAMLIVKEPDVTLTLSNYVTNLVKFNFYINMILGAVIGIVFTLIAVLPFFDNSYTTSKDKAAFLAKRKKAASSGIIGDKESSGSDEASGESADESTNENTDENTDKGTDEEQPKD